MRKLHFHSTPANPKFLTLLTSEKLTMKNKKTWWKLLKTIMEKCLREYLKNKTSMNFLLSQKQKQTNRLTLPFTKFLPSLWKLASIIWNKFSITKLKIKANSSFSNLLRKVKLKKNYKKYSFLITKEFNDKSRSLSKFFFKIEKIRKPFERKAFAS